MEIFSKDISELKETTFHGDILKQKEYSKEYNKYLYERYIVRNGKETLIGYEIVIPVKHKNPDGTIVFVYPSSSDFGKKGWYLSAKASRSDIEKIMYCKGNPYEL